MGFKEWLQKEEAMTAGTEAGNMHDPMDNGLFDPEGKAKYRPVPKSALADKLFKGKSFMKKDDFRMKRRQP